MLENYKQLLGQLVRFKSVSTDSAYQPEIQKTVEWYRNLFQGAGFQAQIIKGYDNPLLIADYTTDPNLRTVLVYGHYDVQPASKEEGWESEPFELAEREGRFYARGVIDNKGQALVHIVNVFEHIKNKTLGYNVKFFLEGNEETGSPKLDGFIKERKELLKADFVLLSDGEIAAGAPNIEIGFRGTFNSTLRITCGKVDLHSGLYGGAAPNAIHELSKIIAGFYAADNKLAWAGIYEGMPQIAPAILENNKRIPFSLEEYDKMTGKQVFFSQDNLDFYTQVGLLPCIEVSGIQAGYTGEGYRNAIPYKALAKINVRLAPGQEPEKVFSELKKYVESTMPKYCSFELSLDQQNKGALLETDNEFTQRAGRILSEVWGKPPILKYVGGSLPIITSFKELLGIPQAIIPLVNEDCNMHGANENFDLKYWEKAMEFSRRFFARE